MKKFLNIFFVALGVVFLIVILMGTYFFVVDPLELKPLLFGNKTETINSDTKNSASPLFESQQKTLKTLGIDPADVPSQITAEQEACFVLKLGRERVDEIKAGASPSATELLNAKSCL